ncbi:MAG: lamin tail domain-containing protein, partial [Rhodothermales bacterium]
SDLISLWRVDGDLSSSRIELGRSQHQIAEGDSSLLSISIRRTSSEWTVAVNGDTLIRAADDGRYIDGSYFIYWVKHSPAGAAAFYLDELIVEAGSDPEPLPPPASHRLPVPGEIVINEIQFDPPASGSEYVELLNLSSEAFDLSTIEVRDDQSTPSPLSKTQVLLDPGGYVVLAQNVGSFQEEFPAISPIVPSRWPALNNSGDLVVIEAGGVVIDSVRYESGWSANRAAAERIDPDFPGDRYNFGPSTHPRGGTPGERNSIYRPDVVGPRLLLAEEIDSLAIELSFDEPVRGLSSGDVLAGTIHPTSLTASGDLSVVAVFDREPDASEIHIDTLEDRGGNRTIEAAARVAFRPRRGDVVVNEIMFEPLADAYDGLPDQPEYVEILNVSNRTVSLSGLRKTREADEHHDADTLVVGAAFTTVDSEGYVVIYSGSSLQNAFPNTSSAALYVPALGLRNDGDRIR